MPNDPLIGHILLVAEIDLERYCSTIIQSNKLKMNISRPILINNKREGELCLHVGLQYIY